MNRRKNRACLIFCFLLVSISGPLVAQNMVVNGGFEAMHKGGPAGWKPLFPDSMGILYGAKANKASSITPSGFCVLDWESRCRMGTTWYYSGPAPLPPGNQSVCLILMTPMSPASTAILGQLVAPLEAGMRYTLSMDVASHTWLVDTPLSWFPVKVLRDEREIANPRLQLRATTTPPRPLLTANTAKPFSIDTVVSHGAQNIVSVYDTLQIPHEGVPWCRVSVSFTARGGEKLVLVGRSPDVKAALDSALAPIRIPGIYTATTDIIGTGKPIENDGSTYGFNLHYFVDNLSVTPISPPPPLTAEPQRVEVLFDFGSSTLQPECFPTLEDWTDRLIRQPTVRITLHGHTDNVGSAAANQALSLRRAEAVKAWLVANGVAADRISCIGHGGDVPVADNLTLDGRKRNRRIEITAP